MRLSEGFRAFGAVFALLALLGMGACEEEGAGEKAGKKMDEAAEEVGESMENMKDEMQEK